MSPIRIVWARGPTVLGILAVDATLAGVVA